MIKKAKAGRKGTPDPTSNERSRRATKLIRLDDLIPKKDVKGGRQVLFGVRDDNTGSDDSSRR